jgi:hypothetical protein
MVSCSLILDEVVDFLKLECNMPIRNDGMMGRVGLDIISARYFLFLLHVWATLKDVGE